MVINQMFIFIILYTCKISKRQFNNVIIPKEYDKVEIMIHPGIPEIDRLTPDDVWDNNILSEYRTVELETLLDKDVLNGIN